MFSGREGFNMREEFNLLLGHLPLGQGIHSLVSPSIILPGLQNLTQLPTSIRYGAKERVLQ